MYAKGSVANLLTFRTSSTTPAAFKKVQRYAQTSVNEIDNQTHMRHAAASYRALSVEDLALWRAQAALRRVCVWNLYFREFRIQYCTEGDQPLIPEWIPQ